MPDGSIAPTNPSRPSFAHYVLEVFGLEKASLKSYASILPYINLFLKNTGLCVVDQRFHDFSPHGATLLFILSSSHMAVHTWPENEYLHIDLLTCMTTKTTDVLERSLKNVFPGKKVRLMRIQYA